MTLHRSRSTLVLTIVMLAASFAAGAESDQRSLLARRAELFVDRPGLARLLLPTDVVAQCQADLSDFRIFDARGNEVPFAVDSGVRAGSERKIVEDSVVEVIDLVRGEMPIPNGAGYPIETYRLRLPAGVGHGPTLVARAGTRGTIEVSASTASGAFVQIAPARTLPAAAEIEIPLPEGIGNELAVSLRGRDHDAAAATFVVRVVRTQPSDAVRVALEVALISSAMGSTTVDLVRPSGWVPDSLEIETTSPLFLRAAEVFDVGVNGAVVKVGGGRLARVGEDRGVDEITLRLGATRGDILRIRIDDGDSPPLQDLRVFAVVRRPAVVFALAAVDAGKLSGEILFGGGRLRRPSYDLQRILSQRFGGAADDDRARAELYDSQRLVEARLGEAMANPLFDPAPALHYAMRAGAEVEPGEYRFRRDLQVTSSSDGLSVLRLQPEDVAVLRDDIADLRIVDASRRQWPILVRSGIEHVWTPLSVEPLPRPDDDAGVSRFSLQPRAGDVPIDRLSLRAAGSFFQRAYQLRIVVSEAETRLLSSGQLKRSADQEGPLEIAFPMTRADRLELVVEDGDEAPLSFSSVQARVPQPEVFLVAPSGKYQLLFGRADAAAPRYDVAGIRDVVFAMAGAPVQAGARSENEEYTDPERREWWKSAATRSILWIVIIIAVLVLGALTVRLVRDT